MSQSESLTTDQQIASLEPVVRAAAQAFGLPLRGFESVNHEYNSTFKLSLQGEQAVALRINVNSRKTLANVKAETAWVNSIRSVPTPKPVCAGGESVISIWHEPLGRALNCVAYSWLEGSEPGDEPTEQQLFAMGAAMARLHAESIDFELPSGCELPVFDDVLWGNQELLLGDDSGLSEQGRQDVAEAYTRLQSLIGSWFAVAKPQLIHADLHPWNVMWHEGKISVFDFDDCGWGFPLQDLAVALYYLDTDEQDAAFKQGYESVSSLPEHTEADLAALMIQRRLILANFLLESTNPEHRDILPEYLAETERRLRSWLAA